MTTTSALRLPMPENPDYFTNFLEELRPIAKKWLRHELVALMNVMSTKLETELLSRLTVTTPRAESQFVGPKARANQTESEAYTDGGDFHFEERLLNLLFGQQEKRLLGRWTGPRQKIGQYIVCVPQKTSRNDCNNVLKTSGKFPKTDDGAEDNKKNGNNEIHVTMPVDNDDNETIALSDDDDEDEDDEEEVQFVKIKPSNITTVHFSELPDGSSLDQSDFDDGQDDQDHFYGHLDDPEIGGEDEDDSRDVIPMDDSEEVGSSSVGSDQQQDRMIVPTRGDNSNKKTYFEILHLTCPQAECVQSDLKFQDVVQFDEHMARVHSVKKCRCFALGCGQSFNYRTQLRDHLARAHADLASWQCAHCEMYSYASHRLLRTHVTQVHWEGHFRCNFADCDHQDNNRRKMYHHYHQKHSVDHLKCSAPDCDFVGRSRFQVYKHFKQTHARKNAAVRRNTKNAKPTESKPTREYTCSAVGCDQKEKFATYYALKAHIRAKHEEPKQYRCKWADCVYSSGRRYNTLRHVKFHQERTQLEELKLKDPRQLIEIVAENGKVSLMSDIVSYVRF